MSSLKIQKAKLNSTRTLYVEYSETITKDDGGIIDDTNKRTCSLIAHPDLIKAFEALTPHLVMICEQPEADALRTFEDLNEEELKEAVAHFNVASFTLGKNSEGVTISGGRELSTGETLNLNTPHTEIDGKYQHEAYLSIALDNVIEEVKLYLGGKEAPAVQGDLFNQETDHNTDMEL